VEVAAVKEALSNVEKEAEVRGFELQRLPGLFQIGIWSFSSSFFVETRLGYPGYLGLTYPVASWRPFQTLRRRP